MLRIGELFSGYGGLGMGVQSVIGGDIVWHSDIDKGACKVLAHRYPDVPNLDDITCVDWSQVEPVDVLTGGSPCQDLSHAGKRGGMTEGTRSNLWVAMREAIAQLRPGVVVWENVEGAASAAADSELETRPGLLGSVRRRDGEPVLRALGRVVGDLSSLGYVGRVGTLRASDVGAPHGRRRRFLIAYADSEGRSGVGRQHPARRDADRCGGPDGPGQATESSALLPTPTSSDTNGAGAHGDGGADLRTAVALLPTPTTEPDTGNGHARNLGKETRLLPTPKSTDAKNDGPSNLGRHSPGLVTIGHHTDRWGDYAAAIVRWETVLGRPAPPPTMTSAKGNPQLSPRFVEWMQGLPTGWVTDVPGITRNEALRALGNGVVPQQCAAALRLMLGQAVAA